jgi:hypothetical protein
VEQLNRILENLRRYFQEGCYIIITFFAVGEEGCYINKQRGNLFAIPMKVFLSLTKIPDNTTDCFHNHEKVFPYSCST